MRTRTATDGENARDPLDRCYTDPRLAVAIVAWLYAEGLARTARIVEPSVGDGVFLRALLDAGHDPDAITVVDVDPNAEGLRLAAQRGVVAVRRSFFDLTGGIATAHTAPHRTPAPFDLVLGNPPYSAPIPGIPPKISAAEAFIRAGLIIADRVVYVQPLLFLGGSGRTDRGLYLRLAHVEALSPRPRFHGPGVPGKGNGGAMMEYGAFVYDRAARDRAARDRAAWTGGHTRWT